jgi:hypothetical protein
MNFYRGLFGSSKIIDLHGRVSTDPAKEVTIMVAKLRLIGAQFIFLSYMRHAGHIPIYACVDGFSGRGSFLAPTFRMYPNPAKIRTI